MMKVFYLFIIFFLITSDLNAQYVNVKLNSTYIGGEEWIAMNPKNTNQIVVGTHVCCSLNLISNMLYFYSINGGLQWSFDTLTSTIAQPGADPVILVDTAGNFYYICVANNGTPPPQLDKLLCFKSTNGGMNWNNGIAFAHLYPKFDDMPMACVDFSNSPYRNSIYVTWTLYDSILSQNPNDSSYVYFSKSTDEGSTFSTPVRVSKIAGSCAQDFSTPEGPVPSTGINGEVYVCYPFNEQVLFNRSTDAGITWLNNEIIVSSQPGGWRMRSSPVITCDLSQSPYRGNVYIIFSDTRNGYNDRDIWLIKSTNSGNNWSNPVRVNNDGPGHMQEMPWICVDPVTGYIWVVFYDSRNYSVSTRYDTYVARSTDGGNTFQNAKVSNSSSWTYNFTWLGDYMSITAFNNKVRPVWATSLYGDYRLNIYTAIIDSFTIGVKQINSEVPYRFMLYQNFPNPFNPETNIRYSVPVRSQTGVFGDENVVLKIYNVLGKEIETIVNEKQNAGTYEVTFDGSKLASGIYFYMLQTRNFTDMKKMILLK